MFDFSFLLSAFQLFRTPPSTLNHQRSTSLHRLPQSCQMWQSSAAAKSCRPQPLGSRGRHESVKSEDRHRHYFAAARGQAETLRMGRVGWVGVIAGVSNLWLRAAI